MARDLLTRTQPSACCRGNFEELNMKTRIVSALLTALSLVAVQAHAATGKEVFDQTCAACHASGAAGAPKVGDKAAWAPRIATGVAALQNSALKGKGVMPAKGGNGALSDADVAAAVEYLVSQAK
jgi:cytochrome c5